MYSISIIFVLFQGGVMKNRKIKMANIAVLIICLLFLSIPASFIYTRFCLDKYEMKDNTIKFKNNVYIRKDSISDSDQEGLGKAIGIGVYGKRTITDLIWPFWVMEYKGDKEHNRIFVRGLMDVGSVYTKVPK